MADAMARCQDEGVNISKDEAHRRRAFANAITDEVAAGDALKLVVHRHETEADLGAFCQALKSGLSNAGSKIAARAAKIVNPAEIQDLWQVEINRAFDTAKGDLIERWSDDLYTALGQVLAGIAASLATIIATARIDAAFASVTA